MPFDNRSVEIHLSEDLRDVLISSFQKDGRLRIVYDDPDSILEGEIIEYSSTVYGFDIEENIEEYMVSIVFSLTFTDLVRNEVIWENTRITLMERYSPLSTEAVKLTDEEAAQKAIFDDLFGLIIRNSLESW